MITSVVLIIILLLIAVTLHKVRKIHLLCYQLQSDLHQTKREMAKSAVVQHELRNLYSQLQQYDDLNKLLHPTQPFPLLRGWAASPDFLLEICRHSLTHRPKLIIECSSGASTLALARSCQINGMGHVFSLEHDSEFAAKTRSNLLKQGLADWATVVDAPLLPQPAVDNQAWYSLENLEVPQSSVSMLVIDGPPWNTAPLARHPALPLLHKFLSTECTVFLDDAARPDEQEAVKRWMATYPEFTLSWPECEKGCAKLTQRDVYES